MIRYQSQQEVEPQEHHAYQYPWEVDLLVDVVLIENCIFKQRRSVKQIDQIWYSQLSELSTLQKVLSLRYLEAPHTLVVVEIVVEVGVHYYYNDC
jgi:hypothetical protein